MHRHMFSRLARHLRNAAPSPSPSRLLLVRGFARVPEPPKPRPACYSDRLKQTISFTPNTVLPKSFWEEVADEKSVQDAPKYINNIERYVGTVKVPVGLVGPLRVLMEEEMANSGNTSTIPESAFVSQEFLVPLATHEGALLASYNRGCKAITMSGGATAAVLCRQMIRAPVFIFDRVSEAARFMRWFRNNHMHEELSQRINSQPHCHATNLHLVQTERCVHLHIGIDSEDAAGQNMVTYCGRIAMDFIKERFQDPSLREMYIEGGFNVGKRGSHLHLSMGKGLYTVVDAVLPHDIVKDLLHTTPEKLVAFQRMHQRSGSFTGTLSSTGHVANGLTAFFIANGQDPACAVESQAAATHFDFYPNPTDPSKPSLYAAMTLPSLIVSTIGGGTGLPSQRALLDVIGVAHPRELACVLAATCLSGELSFYSAMCSDEFDKAHWDATHKV